MASDTNFTRGGLSFTPSSSKGALARVKAPMRYLWTIAVFGKQRLAMAQAIEAELENKVALALRSHGQVKQLRRKWQLAKAHLLVMEKRYG